MEVVHPTVYQASAEGGHRGRLDPFELLCPECAAIYLVMPGSREPLVLPAMVEEEAARCLGRTCPSHPLRFRVPAV